MLTIPKGGRAVLFPVMVKRPNTVIFATCAHAVEGMVGQFEMVVADEEGNVLPNLGGQTKNMILPRELGADLAFVEMQMQELPQVVRLSDQTVSKGSKIHHVRNVMYKDDFKDQTCVISEQEVSPLNRRFSLIDGRYRDTSEQVAVLGRTLKNPLRAMVARSWPGVSGSPIWDQYGNVLGMVCGGNEELTAQDPEYFLVYLPAKAIKKNLELFLR